MKEMVFIIFFILLMAIQQSLQEPHPTSHQTVGHHRANSHSTQHHSPKEMMIPGNSNVVKGITVHGAIIVSDHLEDNDVKEALDTNKARFPGDEQIKKLSGARSRNYYELQSSLPFNLTRWSAVFTGPCPHFRHGHRTERGLMWAHYRIWRDFIYFDPDVMAFAKDKTIQNELKDDFISSADGVFKAYRDGRLFKNQSPFKEDDVIVIFEDDAYSVIDDTAVTVTEELSMMGEDMIYLGWCEGRKARPAPLCAHAYAVKRQGARKLVRYFEPCGAAVDEQMAIFIKNNWVTYRRAHPWSFKTLSKSYNPANDTNYGIFRQCKNQCGSVNGHRRLNDLSARGDAPVHRNNKLLV